MKMVFMITMMATAPLLAFKDSTMKPATNVISHSLDESGFEQAFQETRARVMTLENKDELLPLVDDLEKSSLGRRLIKNRGLDGKMTREIVLYPHYKDIHPGSYPDGEELSTFDENIMTLPVCKATQERFDIFQKHLKSAIEPRMKVASLPCGYMDDLLTLDLPQDVKLVGIDLDPTSLEAARENALNFGKLAVSEFRQSNAWTLNEEGEFDVLTSNGLNIYVESEEAEQTLYGQFFKALKPGGILVTSFLTPPPALDPACEWNWAVIDREKLALQAKIFKDIVSPKWQNFRKPQAIFEKLEAAGFEKIELDWDQQRLFPTVIAYKPQA